MKLSPLKSLLLAAVATATLAGPIMADAQPDRSGDAEQRQADRKARQEARQKQRADRVARTNAPPAKGPPGPARVDRPNRPDRTAPTDRVRPTRPAPTRIAPAGRRALTPERQRLRRNAQTTIQRSFNKDRWRSNWRSRHADRRWWRSHRYFRGWNGIRIGFYFAPGYGYYSVPRSYYNVRYYPGGYLPSYFWRYRVMDWAFWGLPPPPPGCAWIYVNNAILLVDLWDGYIIDVVYDVWYW